MTAPLLDTHAWVWWVIGDSRLSAKHRDALDALPLDDRPRLATISLWEVSMLVSLGRLRLDVLLDAWLADAASPRTVRLIAISPRIACEVADLPDSFHRDPADRIIISTSRIHKLPLLTYDKRMRDSNLAELTT